MRKNIRNFDIIHLHDIRCFQSIICHHYAKKYHIPYILQAHGSVATFFQKGVLKRIFDKIWGRRILRDASRVIALTKREAEQYKSMGVSEDKIEIVPNGIELSEFENLPKRGEFRKRYGLNDNHKIILYLGRIHKIKGLDFLSKAFAALSKDFSDARLVIVGPDDGYLPTLKGIIKELNIEEKLLLTGPLYGEAKLEAYIDADIYVLPSIYETFPVAVLEACACGTPIIVTDRCGIADIIRDNAGWVVEYDKDQLQGALFKILSDEESRVRFGERGKRLVRKQFTWDKVIKVLERIYENISGAK